MKTIRLFLFTLLLALTVPGLALASGEAGAASTVLDHVQIPAHLNPDGDTIFRVTDLAPPARGDDENFYLISRGGECDSQVNVGLIYQKGNVKHILWLEPTTGNPGYFNMVGADYRAYALTLVDLHTGQYHSMVIRIEESGALTLAFNKSTAIPLPKDVWAH